MAFVKPLWTLLVGLILATGCVGARSATQELASVPVRASTVGDSVLDILPDDSSFVLELDIARLRENPKSNLLLKTFFAGGGFNVYEEASAVVLVGFHTGTERAQILSLVQGANLPVGVRFGKWIAIGEDVALARLRDVERGAVTALADNRRFLRKRAGVMPARAKGASIRLTAQLNFDGRVELSRLLGAAHMPEEVALWGDIADDAAILLRVTRKGKNAGAKMEQFLETLLRRVEKFSGVRNAKRFVSQIEIRKVAGGAQLVLVVGPKRLERLIARFAGGEA